MITSQQEDVRLVYIESHLQDCCKHLRYRSSYINGASPGLVCSSPHPRYCWATRTTRNSHLFWADAMLDPLPVTAGFCKMLRALDSCECCAVHCIMALELATSSSRELPFLLTVVYSTPVILVCFVLTRRTAPARFVMYAKRFTFTLERPPDTA